MVYSLPRLDLPAGWTRATFIIKEDQVGQLKALAYYHRRPLKEVLEEALVKYLKKAGTDEALEVYLNMPRRSVMPRKKKKRPRPSFKLPSGIIMTPKMTQTSDGSWEISSPSLRAYLIWNPSPELSKKIRHLKRRAQGIPNGKQRPRLKLVKK